MTLGALLGAVKRLRGQHGRLVVACSDPHIRRVFEITSLDRVFELAQTQTEALAAFARRDSGVEAGA
jgi:anti-anti-sigma factor